MENQRRLWCDIASLHLADEDYMITFRIAAAIMAFEPGRSALQYRQAGIRQVEIHAIEPIVDAHRKTLGQRGLIA